MSVEAPYGNKCTGCDIFEKVKTYFEGLREAANAQSVAASTNCVILGNGTAIVSGNATFTPNEVRLSTASGCAAGTPPESCPKTQEPQE